MNGLRLMLPGILLIICLGTLGCIGQPAAETRGQNATVTGSRPPSAIISEPTQCTSPANETPWIIINPVGDQYAGDAFEINGITNIGVTTPIKIEGYQSHFYTESKYHPHVYTHFWGNVTVHRGYCGINRWSFWTPTSSLFPDEYFVDVTSEDPFVTNRSAFIVYPAIREEEHRPVLQDPLIATSVMAPD